MSSETEPSFLVDPSSPDETGSPGVAAAGGAPAPGAGPVGSAPSPGAAARPSQRGDDFNVRVDQLFNQVVRRQARQDEATSARIDALRKEILKFRQDLGALRHTTERSENSIKEAIDTRVAKLVSDLAVVGKNLDLIPSALGPAASKIDQVVQRQDSGLAQVRSELAERIDRSEQQVMQFFGEAVGESKTAMQTALIEMRAELAERLERSEEQVRQVFESAIGEAATAIRAELSSVVGRSRGELEIRIQTMQEKLTSDIEVAQEALFEQGGQVVEAASESARKMKFAIESGLGAAMSNAIRPFSVEVRALSDRILQAEARFLESTDKLQRLHRDLMAYLQSRDADMEEKRTRLLVQLLSEAGEKLNRRSRGKLAEGVALAQSKVARQLAAPLEAPQPAFEQPPHGMAIDSGGSAPTQRPGTSAASSSAASSSKGQAALPRPAEGKRRQSPGPVQPSGQEFADAWPAQTPPGESYEIEDEEAPAATGQEEEDYESIVVVGEFDEKADSPSEQDEVAIPRAVLKSSKPKGKKAGKAAPKTKASPVKRR